MSDFAIYWKNFAPDCRRYAFGPSNPLADWRTNSEWLAGKLKEGDRLWFFAAGASCGGGTATAAYLVNVFRVADVAHNIGDDGHYPRDEFRYTVWADRETCVWVCPPQLADEIIRPAGHGIEVHIGRLMRGPRCLADDAAIRLESLLSPEQAARVGIVAPSS